MTRLHNRRWAALEDRDREQLRSLLVDALALAAAGTASEDARAVLAGLRTVGGGDVRVPWTDLHLAAPAAVAAMSTLIHAWDFDDTHDEAVVHTASVVVPTVLAAASIGKADGKSVVDGLATGVQVLSRLARLTGPRTGVIRTAGLGSLAAAAAAATVWGVPDERIEHAMALSLGAALAPGTRQAVVDGSVAKRLQPGLAAQFGFTAAALAAQGVEGPSGWLSGEFGLAPGSDLTIDDLFTGDFEGRWVALKPYPACRYTHAALAAAEALHVRHPRWDDVAQVRVHVPEGPAYSLVSRPYEDRGAPLVDAQFSIPWQLAALWVTGRYDLTTLSGDDLRDPAIAAAAARVVVEQDLPESAVMTGARVEVRATDGSHSVAEAPMPGADGTSRQALARKVESCLRVAAHPDHAGAVADLEQLAAGLPELDAPSLAAALDRCTVSLLP
ncbi:MmgE/PrpD family protein [Gordonia sp. zg691]|uniref:MmgE/PrpD family protein n=1 Tax=Gordonia jinghuaiqii TaxID=2758710 RepID=UPI0016627574|nr:MmgE/PrpD family protein [Gordonia jinghuaiqii]MBD0862853.1 MmgE/PrpD family protein [Gordonia jinghuaiqii]